MVLIDLFILLLYSTQDHHCMAHSDLGPPTSTINTENEAQTNPMGMGAIFFPGVASQMTLAYVIFLAGSLIWI